MIVDTCAWTGHWGTHALPGEAQAVVASLTQIGVGDILLSPLDGVWAHNPHLANRAVYAAAERWPAVHPAPVLAPSLPTWPEALAEAVDAAAPVIRWLPEYASFELTEADDCAAAVGAAGRVLWVQLRLEDARRHHPLAVVSDVPIDAVLALARRHPEVAVVIGGAQWTPLVQLAPGILSLPRLYADTSQVDGMDSLLRLVEAGLAPRLLFGTHAPFFVPLAGLARIVIDLDDDSQEAILGDNARQLFAL